MRKLEIGNRESPTTNSSYNWRIDKLQSPLEPVEFSDGYKGVAMVSA